MYNTIFGQTAVAFSGTPPGTYPPPHEGEMLFAETLIAVRLLQ